jgi:hypothetical protein
MAPIREMSSLMDARGRAQSRRGCLDIAFATTRNPISGERSIRDSAVLGASPTSLQIWMCPYRMRLRCRITSMGLDGASTVTLALTRDLTE